MNQELGDYEGAINTLNQALAIAEKEKDIALERRVLTALGNTHWFNLHYQECLESSLRAIELGRRDSQSQVEREEGRLSWNATRALVAFQDNLPSAS